MVQTTYNVFELLDVNGFGTTQAFFLASPEGIIIQFRNNENNSIASLTLELDRRRVKIHLWNEDDEGSDPTASLTLVHDVDKAWNRKLDKEGNIIHE